MQPGSGIVPRRAYALLFLLLLVCYIWPIEMDPGPNVHAQMDHAAAIVAYKTQSIDAFMGPPHGPNTIDWARLPNGHFYSAKAPGAAFAAVPVWAFLYHVESAAGIDALSGEWFRRNIVMVNWAMNSLVSAVTMVLLLRTLLSLGFSIGPAVFAVLSVALGTVYYPYATAYYAHNPTANLIIAATFVAFALEPSVWRDALVGVLAGFAVVCDYSAILVVPVFAGALMVLRPRGIAAFVAGGLVPAALLAGYHAAVFGGPATTAYKFQNPRFAPPDGALLAVPDSSALFNLTVGPYRGVFFYSPVLVLALAGAWLAIRREGARQAVERKRQVIVWAGVILFVLRLLFNASYHVWWGGWTAGPRHMILGLVLLAPIVSVGCARFPRVSSVLLAISVANHLAISTVLIQVDDEVTNPLFHVIYPRFASGDFERANLGTFLLGLHGLWSIVPLLLCVAVLGFALVRVLLRVAQVETPESRWRSS